MKVSCVIPVYNEESRVSNVVKAVASHHLIDEVIVVNDCSTDNTLEVLKRESGISVISHPVNKGKTQAILTGLHKTKNSLVVLIDSDLLGLSEEALTDLIQPVLDKKVDITISIRKNTLDIYRWIGIDFVSGERAFDKKLLLDNEDFFKYLPGFGLEVFMNNLIIKNNLRLRVVNWDKVISPRKSVKIGLLRGSWGDFKMIIQILKTVSFTTCIYQMYMMRKLSRRQNIKEL